MDASRGEPTIGELVHDHYALVYRVAYRLARSAADAEDLTQQTFLAAGSAIHQLREPAKARGWLCAILKNEFLKNHRRRRRVDETSLEAVGEPTAPDEAGDDIDREKVQLAVAGLADDFRLPVVLFYFNQLSYREIADELEIPIGTVMSRLSRGKAQLRARLTESGNPAAFPMASTGA